MSKLSAFRSAALFVMIIAAAGPAPQALAASASTIDREASAAIAQLYATEPGARELGEKAKAILIFPSIVKAGFMFGAQYGEGALRQGGKTTGYFSSMAGSYGLQAGVQSFSYALFLMDDNAVQYVNNTAGWELGVGPSIVVLDAGKAKAMTTTTVHKGVYAFIFGQKGLMAGLGLQGSKISRVRR